MDRTEHRDVCELVETGPSPDFEEFVASARGGMRLMPEAYGERKTRVLKSDAGDFAKWLRARHPDVPVEVKEAEKLVLRSSDIWLPLVLLASDITLVMYLNIVSSYMYDRLKGALSRDRTRVHLDVEFQDGESGSVKRFSFEGDHQALKAAIKKFDMNHFFDG